MVVVTTRFDQEIEEIDVPGIIPGLRFFDVKRDPRRVDL